MWDLWIKYHTLVLPRVRLKTRITQNRCSTNKHVGSKNDERLVWKQLCARNKVFNRLEALHRKPSLSIAFNTSIKTKKYICGLTFYQATWLTYRERWFKLVTAIRITLIIFEFANLWLDALNEGQVYPWIHRWRLILLVHVYTAHSLSAQNCHSDSFLDQLRNSPPPFGQSPSGLPITQDFFLMLNGKVDPEQ